MQSLDINSEFKPVDPVDACLDSPFCRLALWKNEFHYLKLFIQIDYLKLIKIFYYLKVLF